MSSRRTPRRSPRSLSNRAQVSKSARTGGIRHIPTCPPDFVSAPWYNLIVRIDNPATTLSKAQVQMAIESQLGFTFATNSEVRLHRVRVWGQLVDTASSAPLQPVNMLVFDPFSLSATSRVLEQITGYPDQVNRAALGYEYPLAQRQTTVRLDTTLTAPILALNGMGPNSVVYLNLEWRSARASPPLSSFPFPVDTNDV